MNNIKQILTASLILLGACDLASQSDTAQTGGQANTCGLPAYVFVDPRLTEKHAYDTSHCIQGQSCQFTHINTHEQIVQISLVSGQAPLSDDEMQSLNLKYNILIEDRHANCYVNGQGPFNCGPYLVEFPDNNAQEFLDSCGLVDNSNW